MSRGVPKGFRHIWGYKGVVKERKVAPGRWKMWWTATKRKRSGSMGSVPRGSKIVWDVKGKQYAIKTGKGTYQIKTVLDKKLDNFKKPKFHY